jgi:hypothetical protein
MILGMTARTLSLAIEERRLNNSGSARPLNVDFWDFLYPFLVSFRVHHDVGYWVILCLS